jgi:hypothetical protein
MIVDVDTRYDHNPFISGMIVPVKGQRLQLSTLGKDNNVVVNQTTGEMHGTHVVAYKKVDSAMFVKLFAQNVGSLFNLSSSGIKAFTILVWAVQSSAMNKDIILLDHLVLSDFLAEHEHLSVSIATFGRGLRNLVEAQILARAKRQGQFFINPDFIFNGNRIAFTSLIERVD